MHYSLSNVPSDGIDPAAYLAEVGFKVKTARTDRSLTRRVLSEACGVSERYIAQVESGQGNISILRFKAIADALGVPLSDFLSDDGLEEPRDRPGHRPWATNPKAIAELYEYADPKDKEAILDLLISSTLRRSPA